MAAENRKTETFLSIAGSAPRLYPARRKPGTPPSYAASPRVLRPPLAKRHAACGYKSGTRLASLFLQDGSSHAQFCLKLINGIETNTVYPQAESHGKSTEPPTNSNRTVLFAPTP